MGKILQFLRGGASNHFAQKCGNLKNPQKKPQHTQYVTNENYSLSSDSDFVSEVQNTEARKESYAKLQVQGKPVTFLLDTGASTSVLPGKFVDTSQLNLSHRKSWKCGMVRLCSHVAQPDC